MNELGFFFVSEDLLFCHINSLIPLDVSNSLAVSVQKKCILSHGLEESDL